jgi:serine/threonine protein kinase
MASISKRYREPAPLHYPFAAPVGMKVYCWVGSPDPKQKQLKVDVFDPIRESWKQLDSRGDCPVNGNGTCVVAVGNDMYIFAGSDSDGLHKLDTVTMRWTYINPRGVVRPTPRGGGRLIGIQGNRLVLFAGYVHKVVKKNKNPLKKNTTTGGICDQFHIFHIDKGEWTAPACYGDIPSARSNFVMVPVDVKRAVVFGGNARGNGRADDLFIIHWDSLLWTRIPKTGSWPKGRKAHGACCINYDKPNPLLLMVGGMDREEARMRDMWLLNVNQCRWTQLPDLPHPPRNGHMMIAFPLSDKLVEVTLFGGESAQGKKLSHTCILRFECETEEDTWALVNIIEPADVGRPIERVQEKMESLGLLPSSSQSASSLQSATSNELKGQPLPGGELSAQHSNGEPQKMVRQETSLDGEGGLGHLSARSKRSYIIDLEELEFGRQLGEGAYGTVYAGKWKPKSNVEVAIKKCFNKPFDAEILSVLPRHPNVVFFYATSTSEDATFIVTELVTEGSLYDFIHTDNKDFDDLQAISWAKQIGYGMEHLHGHHIVHRDLKSGNVLISSDMEMKVCDFGTARAVVDKCEQSTVRGTYRWMAPEIMKEDDAIIDKNCDVFSYGCVLYELFERKLPYHKEKNSVFLAMKVLDGLRPEISGEASIPEFLKDLMKACWEEDAQKRPSFEDCITALRMKSFHR